MNIFILLILCALMNLIGAPAPEPAEAVASAPVVTTQETTPYVFKNIDNYTYVTAPGDEVAPPEESEPIQIVTEVYQDGHCYIEFSDGFIGEDGGEIFLG